MLLRIQTLASLFSPLQSPLRFPATLYEASLVPGILVGILGVPPRKSGLADNGTDHAPRSLATASRLDAQGGPIPQGDALHLQGRRNEGWVERCERWVEGVGHFEDAKVLCFWLTTSTRRGGALEPRANHLFAFVLLFASTGPQHEKKWESAPLSIVSIVHPSF